MGSAPIGVGRAGLSVAGRGSIRRECLDPIIVLNERHLMRVLRSYASYYHSSRTHRSLDDDCPDSRPVEPPEMGAVVALAQVGGLHHRYTRRLPARSLAFPRLIDPTVACTRRDEHLYVLKSRSSCAQV